MSISVGQTSFQRVPHQNRTFSWYLRVPLMAARKIVHYIRLIQMYEGFAKPQLCHPLQTDAVFLSLLGQIKANAVMRDVELYNVYQFARQVQSLPGDAAEVGVYRGGTAKLLASVLEKKDLHLFDTFAGMPPVNSQEDVHHAGDFHDTFLQAVKRFLEAHSNPQFHQGFFPETATPVNDRRFCFVHIDADIYQSTLESCAFFYPRMVSGGIMLFHDYEIASCPGVRKAVDQFFADQPEQVLYLPTNQCFVIKQ